MGRPKKIKEPVKVESNLEGIIVVGERLNALEKENAELKQQRDSLQAELNDTKKQLVKFRKKLRENEEGLS